MFKGVPWCNLTGTKVTLDAIIKVNYIVDSNDNKEYTTSTREVADRSLIYTVYTYNTVNTIFAVYIVNTVFTVYFTSMLCRVTLIVPAMRWRI